MATTGFDEGCLGDDLTIAQRALAAGELGHSFYHGTFALQDAAFDLDETLALVRQIYARAPSEDALAFGDVLSYAQAIGFAIGRADRGDFDGASDMMASALQANPAAYGAELLAGWVRAKGRANVHVARALNGAVAGTIGLLHLRPAQQWLTRRYETLARATLDAASADEHAVLMACGVLRRSGDAEAALSGAQRLLREGRVAYDAWVQTALAHRFVGRTDEALAAFHRAFERGGDPATNAYELVRALCDVGRHREALALLPPRRADEGSVELRWMHDWFDELAAGRAGEATAQFGERPTADAFRQAEYGFFAGWAGPRDATIAVLEEARATGAAMTSVACSTMEPPSCRLVLALSTRGAADPREAPYSYSFVPTPDPRVEDGGAFLNVWAYDDRGPYAVNAPPGAAVRAAIAAVRARPVNAGDFWDEARRRGPSLGEGAVGELLGACACEPAALRGQSLAQALFEQQIAAMFLLANVDRGWFESRRRRALLAALRGSVDWSTAAAVIALREVALDESDAREEVLQTLVRLGERVPKPGGDLLAAAVISSYERVPGVTPRDAAAFAAGIVGTTGSDHG